MRTFLVFQMAFTFYCCQNIADSESKIKIFKKRGSVFIDGFDYPINYNNIRLSGDHLSGLFYSEAKFDLGLPNGEIKIFKKDDSSYTVNGEYLNGRKNGNFIYMKNEDTIGILEIRNDKFISEKVFFNNGSNKVALVEISYLPLSIKPENSILSILPPTLKGYSELHGLFIERDSSGNVISVKNWNHGELVTDSIIIETKY